MRLQPRLVPGHASQAAMAIYQHATLDRDKSLAEKISETYTAWRSSTSLAGATDA